MSDQYQPPQSDLVTEGSFDGTALFSPDGRHGRIRFLAHTFWTTTLINIVGSLALLGLGLVSEMLSGIAFFIMIAAMLVVTFIFTIKRCHDFNASGWWSLLVLIPIVNFFFIFKSGTPTTNRFGSVPPPNTALLWIGGLATPVVFVAAMLAAIAIPAYNDYTTRAQVGEVFASSAATKTAVAQFYQNTGKWPTENDLSALNLSEPVETRFSLLYVYPDTGVIEAVMMDTPTVSENIANGSIVFTPKFENNTLNFDCESDNIGQNFLPRSCQGAASKTGF